MDDALASLEEASDLLVCASHLRVGNAALHGDRLARQRAVDHLEADDGLGI